MNRVNFGIKSLVIGVIILSSFFITGCEDVISLDLNNVEPLTVIEGEITDTSGLTTVKLSKSTDYNNQNGYEKISNALVSINNEAGEIFVLTESEHGVYTTSDLQVEYNEKYNLKVLANDNEYLAETILEEPLVIDSLKIDIQGGLGNDNYRVRFYFHDTPGVKNYAVIKMAINGVFEDRYNVYEDRLSDGRYFSGRFRVEKNDLSIGDTVLIEVKTISKSTFEFYETLTSVLASDEGGSPLEVSSPANPKSNISNNGLGFFGGYSISRKSIIVE